MTRFSMILTITLLSAFYSQVAMPSDEGIHIRGHWKLTIFEPDGQLNRVVEIENALLASGAEILSSILTRGATSGEWQVLLSHQAGTDSVCGTSETPAACVIAEPTSISAAATSLNLVVTDNLDGSFELSGSVTAANNGSIDEVQTRLLSCNSSINPDSCEGANIFIGSGFTSASIAAEAVSEGQIVQATVTLSFN